MMNLHTWDRYSRVPPRFQGGSIVFCPRLLFEDSRGRLKTTGTETWDENDNDDNDGDDNDNDTVVVAVTIMMMMKMITVIVR